MPTWCSRRRQLARWSCRLPIAILRRSRVPRSTPLRPFLDAARGDGRLADQLGHVDRGERAAAGEDSTIAHDGVDVRGLALKYKGVVGVPDRRHVDVARPDHDQI